MRDLIIWKILLIGFHFDIRDNKVSNILQKMSQSDFGGAKMWKYANTLKINDFYKSVLFYKYLRNESLDIY